MKSAQSLASIDLTVRDLVEQRAMASSGEQFIEAVDGSLTFDDFASEVDRWACAMVVLGLAKGDRVCILASNNIATPVAWVAVAYAGGIQVPLNIHHKAMMHNHILNDCKPRILLVDPKFAPELPRRLPDCIEHVVPLGSGDLPVEWPVRTLPLNDATSLPGLKYCEPSGIQYTSGTTGPTKGVLSSHRFMINFVRPMIDAWGIDSQDTIYNPFPQCHSSGQSLGVMASLISGAGLIMDERFSLRRYLPRVKETSSTIGLTLFNTLTLLESLEPGPEDVDHHLRLLYSTPAPREQVLRVENRFRVKVRQNYGSTELGIVACQEYEGPRLGSVGRPSSQVVLMPADEFDNPVPANIPGQILVRPTEPFSMLSGYWERPEAMAGASRNLWFHSGDLGYFDDDGNLYFLDRMQDVIRLKGEFVSAAELEASIVEHPGVEEAAAIAVAGDRGADQDVLMFLVAKPGMEIDPANVLEFCRRRMAYFMVPRYMEVVEELPRTMNGKVRKSVLRDRGIRASTFDCGARRVPPRKRARPEKSQYSPRRNDDK